MCDFKVVKELFLERDWGRDGGMFHHRQVFNNGKVYVYEVSFAGSGAWYEVFRRKVVHDICNIDGKFIKSDTNGHVKYPGNEDFGKWAKNCISFTEGSNDRFDAWYWVNKWSCEAQI